MPHLPQAGEGEVKQCQRCGRWGDVERHHKVPKGMGAGKGFDFPANYIDLCWDCHQGNSGAHRDPGVMLQYKLDVQDYLLKTLTKSHYLPEDLVKILKLPKEQAQKVVRPLFLESRGYRREDIIRQLMGGKIYDWTDKYAV